MAQQIVTLRTEDRWRRWMMVGVVGALTLSSGAIINERALFSPLADDAELAGIAPVAYAMLVPGDGGRGPGSGLRRPGGGRDVPPTAFGAIPQPDGGGTVPGVGVTGAPGAASVPPGAPALSSVPDGGGGAPGGGGTGGSLPDAGGSPPGGGGTGTTPGGGVIPPVVSAVPEPATWAMMILGLAFIGGLMRRQRRQATTGPTGAAVTA